MKNIYIAIDLKSFYASVECVERGLDPLKANLVVADITRTEKTICLAVSPSLKAYGISGRARLFEVIQKLLEVNRERLRGTRLKDFRGSSTDDDELKRDKTLKVDYIAAPPRMAKYMAVSAKIYSIYLKYVAVEDIHAYSIDEVFIDATKYLKLYKMNARQFAMMLIKDVLRTTGITATAGIGTNMYLAKIAMDIVAKKMPADENGVRIAALDERSYREKLWTHEPITDFWRIGPGYARKLAENNMFTMGDVARCSLGGPHSYYNQQLLYKLFGVNAEFLIDHAWGREPVTIADVRSYVPENTSICSGQVLSEAYPCEKGKLIVREMADLLVLDLVKKSVKCDQIVLTIGYDTSNVDAYYNGEISIDHYGRKIPKHAHGTINLGCYSSSTELITEKAMELYDRIINPKLLIRRVSIDANHVVREKELAAKPIVEEYDLFADFEALEKAKQAEKDKLERERRRQEAILKIQEEFGKNAILKGMNLQEGAKTIERNGTIGGHKA